jgi:dihydrofolate reductase
MELIHIVAKSNNHCIGKNNQLLWHLSEDLKFFKRTTSGNPVIMGRKTFESIGKPLPNRRNIVITRNTDWKFEGVEVVHSIQEAIDLLQTEAKAFIIGGAEIYKETLSLCNTLYITNVDINIEGDKTTLSEILVDEKSQIGFQFFVYQR